MKNLLNIKSFFKFLERNKWYSFITVFGLSLSLMFVIIIAVYTINELSTDNFQENKDRIYVIHSESSLTYSAKLVNDLHGRYPDIEKIAAIRFFPNTVIEIDNSKIKAEILTADSTFFDIFSFKFIEGEANSFKYSKENVVISKSFANKIGGDKDLVGSSIKLNEHSFTIAGIMEDIKNSTVPYADVIINLEKYHRAAGMDWILDNYSNATNSTLFLLASEGSDITRHTGDIKEFFKTFFWWYKDEVVHEVYMTPLKEVYFSKISAWYNLMQGDRLSTVVLLAVSIIILIFALINYINLTVAQSLNRAKEMSTRRLLGSSRGELFTRLIMESVIICFIASIIGFGLAYICSPLFLKLTGKTVDLTRSMRGENIIWSLLGVLGIGLFSGLIPATIISRYKPIEVVRSYFTGKSRMAFSKFFIVFQNLITIILIGATMTSILQVKYLMNKDLGYITEDILQVRNNMNTNTYKVFMEEVSQLPFVEIVTGVRGTPVDGGNNQTMTQDGITISFQTLYMDTIAFNMFGFKVIRDNGIYSKDGYWLGVQSVKELGLDFEAQEFKFYGKYLPVNGILEDFQIREISEKQTPILLRIDNNIESPWSILIKINGDAANTYKEINNIYKDLNGGIEMEAEYMEMMNNQYYEKDKRLSNIIWFFTAVAVLISMLGLVAMSYYFINQRAKEIAVRKIFGSTNKEILERLVKYFMRLVATAFVISIPLLFFLLRSWLNNYPERINLSPSIFLTAGIFAFIIAFASVFIQSYNAANKNPVDSLKKITQLTVQI